MFWIWLEILISQLNEASHNLSQRGLFPFMKLSASHMYSSWFVYLLLISRDGKITNKIPNVLAVIIWNMLVKNVPYKNPEGYLYLDQKRKLGLVKRIKKQIDKFDIKPEVVGFLNT